MSHRRLSFAIVGFVLVMGVGLSSMAGDANAPEKTVMPAVQIVGHNSKITDKRFVLVQDERTWRELWSEHTGVAAAGPPTRYEVPMVDFARYMVVGSFNGAGTNTDGQIVQSITPGDGGVRIRFETSSFQTASFGPGPDKGVKTSCFGLWVIDRTDKPIILEKARQGLKADPVRWVEVKRFEGK